MANPADYAGPIAILKTMSLRAEAAQEKEINGFETTSFDRGLMKQEVGRFIWIYRRPSKVGHGASFNIANEGCKLPKFTHCYARSSSNTVQIS